MRSVALSTNSVAASVEPVIQQQFFTLSPMTGQEPFPATAAVAAAAASSGSHPILNDTPTTSSMLAALHESFAGGPLDAAPSTFNSDSYVSIGYVEPNAPHDESMSGVGNMFGDYNSSTSFDVASFTPDLSNISNDSVPPPPPSSSEHSSPDHKSESVKDEPIATSISSSTA